MTIPNINNHKISKIMSLIFFLMISALKWRSKSQNLFPINKYQCIRGISTLLTLSIIQFIFLFNLLNMENLSLTTKNNFSYWTDLASIDSLGLRSLAVLYLLVIQHLQLWKMGNNEMSGKESGVNFYRDNMYGCYFVE